MSSTRSFRRSLLTLVAAVLAVAATYRLLLHPLLAAHGQVDAVGEQLRVDVVVQPFGRAVLAVAVTALATAAALLTASVLGHLVGRHLRRSGPTRLPRWIGTWVTSQRRRRAPVSLEMVLGRDDRASPYEVSKLLDGLVSALRPRWYERFLLGPDTFTLTLLNDTDNRTLRMLAGVRTDTASAFEHRLRATYPDVRVQRTTTWADELAEHRRSAEFDVARLKKARRWMWSLQTTRDYEHSLVEALGATIAGSGTRCIVSLALTPAPLLLERHAARQLRHHEQRLNQAATGSPSEPGAASAVEQRHIKGAVEAVGRSLVAFDLRIVVPTRRHDLIRQLAGVANEARSENHLVIRHMRARRTLVLARVARHQPPLLPAVRTGVLTTAELATLWQLPTLRLKGVGLHRAGARQISASPAISRDATDMVLRDEHGPVGVRPADRRYGWAILGGQGVGKTSLLLRLIGNTARDRDRALVIVDPKVDLARDALTTIPTDRVVHYVDLAHPYVGFNPLTVLRSRAISPEVVADLVVAAIRETAGETAVGPRSDQFLRSAIAAVCTVEDEPTLAHAHRLLDPDDPGYRTWLVRELDFHPQAGFLRDFWGRSFNARIRSNPRFVAEILEAPRNKLSRFLAVESLSYLTSHPVPLDLAGIVDRGEILILNGNKAAVGEDNAVLVCQLLVLCIQKLLHQQQQLDHDQRRRVALVIDEAHNMFTPTFATMLSEGRSAGVEVTAAFQYTGQITDDRVRTGIKSLLQNISIFRLREFEDARAAAALAMDVFADSISADIEHARRLRVDPLDIINQPNHQALNLWIANGRPQPAFTATTTPIETAIARAAGRRSAAHHLRAQRDRGHHPHDLGLHIEPPAIWTADSPLLCHGRAVHVDVTTWENRPDLHAPMLRMRTASGVEHAYRLTPTDRSGRRFVSHVPADADAAGYLPDGAYGVSVTISAREWHPTQIEHVQGNEYRENPATAVLRTPRASAPSS